MRHKGLAIILVIALFIGGSFILGMFAYLMGASGDNWSFGGNVGVVNVEGTIISADNVVEEISGFRKDDSIKSVILRVESPGGSVAASQEILEAVSELAAKKPVVASMGAVAASGGYYVACGASKILANPGTVTGSIGVRMEHVMLGDLLNWMKVKHETLKSGKFKDLAAFDRQMTPEERKILEDMLADIHVQFKEAVSKARNLDIAKVDEIADGRIYTGRQALEIGLVDELGGLPEAIKLAAKLGNVKGEPKLVYPKKKNRFIERIFDSATDAVKRGAVTLDYWQPLLMMETTPNA